MEPTEKRDLHDPNHIQAIHHSQEHGDNCPCGHGHGHHHEEHHGHGDGCSCGHEHHSHGDSGQHRQSPDADTAAGIKFTCLVENLGCANCAAKMERRINELPEVNAATLTFATKQLRVAIAAEHAGLEDALVAKFQEICASIEPETVVRRQQPSQKGKKSLSSGEQEKSGNRRLSEQQLGLLSIIIGASFFAAGELLGHFGMKGAFLPSAAFVVSYIILGGRIVLAALRNLCKGQVFDENFLMSLATLGAFAIGNFPEAVGVMLFYRIGEYFEETAVARSRSQIMDVVDLRPEVVTLVLGADTKTVNAEDAQVNDILLVRPGDRIPLDGVVVEGESRLDTSPITGEPVPVKAAAKEGTIAVAKAAATTNGV